MLRIALLVLLAPVVLHAEEAALSNWAQRLGSDSVEERAFAAEVLARAGESAREALDEAAGHADAELRYRAWRLLDRLAPVLHPVDPKEARGSKSAGGSKRHILTFRNKRNKPVKLFWIDYNGGEKFYGIIDAGGTREQSTMAEHIWVVSDSQDRDLIAFRTTDRDAQAVIPAK